MINVLISAPSLKSNSGISTFVINTINNCSGVRFLHGEIGQSNYHKTRYRLFIQIIRFVHKCNSVDIVHINMAMDMKSLLRDMVLVLASRMLFKKVVSHFHGGEFIRTVHSRPFVFFFYKVIKFCSHRVVFLSNYERDSIDPFDKKVRVIPNGVPIPLLKAPKIIECKILEVIYIGRLDLNKGISEILNAMYQVQKEGLNFKLCIYGDGPAKDIISMEIDNLGLTNTFLRGSVSGNKKLEVLRGANILLLPSYFEGMPFSLLECMSFGIVPIVTPVGSMSDIVEDGNNGFLVKLKSSFEIVEKMKLLGHNSGLYESMSRNAYDSIRSKFSISRSVELINDLYNDMLVDRYNV